MILGHAILSATGLLTLGRRQAAASAAKLWASPDGSMPDFATTFYAESTIDISWRGLNSSYADLWVVTYDYTNANSFSQLLMSENP